MPAPWPGLLPYPGHQQLPQSLALGAGGGLQDRGYQVEEAPPPPASVGRAGFERLSSRLFVVPADTTAPAVVEELNGVYEMGTSEKTAMVLVASGWDDEGEFATAINKAFRVKGGKAGAKFWKGVREAVMKLCGMQDLLLLISGGTSAVDQVQALLKNVLDASDTKAAADSLVGLKSGKVLAVLMGWEPDEVRMWPLVVEDPIPVPTSREELGRRHDPDDLSHYYTAYSRHHAPPRQVPPRQRQQQGWVNCPAGQSSWANSTFQARGASHYGRGGPYCRDSMGSADSLGGYCQYDSHAPFAYGVGDSGGTHGYGSHAAEQPYNGACRHPSSVAESFHLQQGGSCAGPHAGAVGSQQHASMLGTQSVRGAGVVGAGGHGLLGSQGSQPPYPNGFNAGSQAPMSYDNHLSQQQQMQMRVQIGAQGPQSVIPYGQQPMTHVPQSMHSMSACCGGSVSVGGFGGNGIGAHPLSSNSYGAYDQGSWEALPSGSAGQPASMQGGIGNGSSGGAAGGSVGSGLGGYAANGHQSYGNMSSCGIGSSLSSMRQADERAAAEALWTQQMPRAGSSGGVGSGNAGSDTCSLPAGLAASASQFGMSANAPAFTPGVGIGASGSSGATAGTVGGVSFEADSLRAVRCPRLTAFVDPWLAVHTQSFTIS